MEVEILGVCLLSTVHASTSGDLRRVSCTLRQSPNRPDEA